MPIVYIFIFFILIFLNFCLVISIDKKYCTLSKPHLGHSTRTNNERLYFCLKWEI